jgi:phosphatidylserine/phosphatidylglycerophosphate/cardiolipin synthase-like enzyme
VSFPPDVALLDAERVDLLWGGDALPAVVAGVERAGERIEVTMFILELVAGSEVHGRVRDLLDAVVRAAHRGVLVRVLVDDPRDEATRLVLNELAAQYLLAADVEVRYDVSEEASNHSKYVLIDDGEAIVGSGNWSAGGLLGNVEAGVRVLSPPLCRQLRARFDRDWALGRLPEPVG